VVVVAFYRNKHPQAFLRLVVNEDGTVETHGADAAWMDYNFKPYSPTLGREVSFDQEPLDWARALAASYNDEELNAVVVFDSKYQKAKSRRPWQRKDSSEQSAAPESKEPAADTDEPPRESQLKLLSALGATALTVAIIAIIASLLVPSGGLGFVAGAVLLALIFLIGAAVLNLSVEAFTEKKPASGQIALAGFLVPWLICLALSLLFGGLVGAVLAALLLSVALQLAILRSS
jgi:hypothetical protein